MSLKAQFDLSEAQSELCSCSQSFWKAPGRSCWDMSLLKREGLGDHGAHLFPVGSNPWPDPVQGVRAGLDCSPRGMVGRRRMSTALVLHRSWWSRCLAVVQWQPDVPKAWGWCFACASLHTALGQSISTVPPRSLNPLISQSFGPKPTPQCLEHLMWKVRKDGAGLALGQESSWEHWGWDAPSVSALQTGSSLLSPQPD